MKTQITKPVAEKTRYSEEYKQQAVELAWGVSFESGFERTKGVDPHFCESTPENYPGDLMSG